MMIECEERKRLSRGWEGENGAEAIMHAGMSLLAKKNYDQFCKNCGKENVSDFKYYEGVIYSRTVQFFPAAGILQVPKDLAVSN
jgi:hypothetical protein